jgi:hypothetical protein
MNVPRGRGARIGVGLMAVGLIGVANSNRLAPPGQLPPNTVLLSTMMQELSERPGFTEAMLAELDKGAKKGPALLTPALIDDLRKRILGKDWHGLDHFPGWTMQAINPTVRVIGHVAGKSETAEDMSAVHPGASPSAAQTSEHLDLGPYALDESETISLKDPSTLPGFTTDGLVSELGAGVVRGDGPSELAPEHAQSQRLAYVLNRLAVNRLDGAEPFTVWRTWPAVIEEAKDYPGPRDKPNMHTSTPEQLIRDLQATGHEVTVTDSRYFANFGHLHYKGQDVMMPFYVNSQIMVPGTKRPLLVPVSHAEYEWHIRGPLIDADVSHYFGIDGKSEWRTMDTLDQAWVMKRDAHTYRGAEAVEVTRLAGLLTVAYMRLHAAHPKLPFGGYYALGVCQDVVAAIELKMTGKATLFPNTADGALFDDARDAEVNALIRALPKDRDGKAPEPERIFGSLPTEDLEGISVPGLGADLVAVHTAWMDGTLERTRTWKKTAAEVLLFSMGALLLVGAVRRARRLTRK